MDYSYISHAKQWIFLSSVWFVMRCMNVILLFNLSTADWFCLLLVWEKLATYQRSDHWSEAELSLSPDLWTLVQCLFQVHYYPLRGGHGNPLQYSCLENPMDRGARRATVHGVAKSQTWLKPPSIQACIIHWSLLLFFQLAEISETTFL